MLCLFKTFFLYIIKTFCGVTNGIFEVTGTSALNLKLIPSPNGTINPAIFHNCNCTFIVEGRVHLVSFRVEASSYRLMYHWGPEADSLDCSRALFFRTLSTLSSCKGEFARPRLESRLAQDEAKLLEPKSKHD